MRLSQADKIELTQYSCAAEAIFTARDSLRGLPIDDAAKEQFDGACESALQSITEFLEDYTFSPVYFQPLRRLLAENKQPKPKPSDNVLSGDVRLRNKVEKHHESQENQ